MNLQQWLEIQGARTGDRVMYLVGDYACDTWGYPNAMLEPSEYNGEQLYRLIDGELKRVDRPINYCHKCNKPTTTLPAGWILDELFTGENQFTCPDCQKKEKIKVKPCPRCGYVVPRVYKHSEIFTVTCHNCGWYLSHHDADLVGLISHWNLSERHENIHIEVSDND